MSNGKEPFVNLISDSIRNINLSKLESCLKMGCFISIFCSKCLRSLTHPSVLIRIRQGHSKQLNQVLMGTYQKAHWWGQLWAMSIPVCTLRAWMWETHSSVTKKNWPSFLIPVWRNVLVIFKKEREAKCRNGQFALSDHAHLDMCPNAKVSNKVWKNPATGRMTNSYPHHL